MKKANLGIGLLFALLLLTFFSCTDKLDTEFGNSVVYFSNSSASVSFVDSATVAEYSDQPDTTIFSVGVYRSGIVENLGQITLSLALDSAYLKSQIDAAQVALPVDMTDLMNMFVASNALGGYYCSIPSSVVIPAGQRSAIVPVVLKKSKIKLYNNTVFNYNKNFNNLPYVGTSNRFLVIPLKITASSSIPILESQQRCYIKILKSLVVK